MEFLTIVAAIAALVWGAAFVLRGSVLAGCLAFIVLTTCFGYDFLHFNLAGMPLTLDRIWVGVMLVIYLIHRRLGMTDPKPMARVDWMLIAFLGLVSFSTLMIGKEQGFGSINPLIWHLFVGYLFPAMLYWFARQSTLKQSSVQRTILFLAVFGVYLGLTGLLEVAQQWSLVFPKYIADPKVGLHFGRARGPMVQSVSYGLYLGICIVAALLWQGREEARQPGKLFWLLLVPMELAAVMLTLTRSVWIGTGLALFLLAILTLKGMSRRLVVSAMVGAALLVLVAKSDSLLSIEREGGSASDAKSSAESRGGFAYLSWKMFQDRPLWGFGFGQFPDAKLDYIDDRSTDLNLDIIRPLIHHNTYLSLLVDLGLVGLLLYLTVLVLWARAAWELCRGVRRPVWVRTAGVLFLCSLATYGVQMMFHEVSYTSIDNSIIFVLAGIVTGLANGGADSRRTDLGRSSDQVLPNVAVAGGA
ncbi:MAG: O-antigen ligase family protein [Planctomycetota bacterium]|nr:O-antigen ligase family protein [Planctomycetota bacterium]